MLSSYRGNTGVPPFYCTGMRVSHSVMRIRVVVCMTAVLALAACAPPPRGDVPMRSSTEAASHDPVFSDVDLEELLLSTPAGGLIYVWSPHMPYSVKGLRDIADIGGRVGLSVTPLLDPYAEARLSARVVEEAGLPPAALRSLNSPALFDRGATLHFPTLFVFAHGRLAEHMLPGYTSPAVYEAFIEEQLAHIVRQDAPRLSFASTRAWAFQLPSASNADSLWMSASASRVSRY